MDKKIIYLQPDCYVFHVKVGQVFMGSSPVASINNMDYDGDEEDW